MGDAELVEMVNVGEAEDDGDKKNDGGVGGAGEEEDRDGGGAKEHFFRDRTLPSVRSSFPSYER